MQRVYRGRQEHFVKWALQDDRPTNTTDALKKSRDGLCKEYFVWMRVEEMKACCPQLLAMETRPRIAESARETQTASGAV